MSPTETPSFGCGGFGRRDDLASILSKVITVAIPNFGQQRSAFALFAAASGCGTKTA